MKKKWILILGAKSDIGLSAAYYFAKFNYNIQLAARNVSDLERVASDINIRYEAIVSLHEYDINNKDLNKSFINSLSNIPDIVLNSVGYMGDQEVNQKKPSDSSLVYQTNFEGPSVIFSEFANIFEERGFGTLIGISSVAGERGRATNYIYGSAKAGYTAFLSGLRNRLVKKNVSVLTVLPGFVDTKMTKNMNLPKKLTAKPEDVAKAIFLAVKNKKDVIYVKPIWKWIIIIIKLIPENIFKNLKL